MDFSRFLNLINKKGGDSEELSNNIIDQVSNIVFGKNKSEVDEDIYQKYISIFIIEEDIFIKFSEDKDNYIYNFSFSLIGKEKLALLHKILFLKYQLEKLVNNNKINFNDTIQLINEYNIDKNTSLEKIDLLFFYKLLSEEKFDTIKILLKEKDKKIYESFLLEEEKIILNKNRFEIIEKDLLFIDSIDFWTFRDKRIEKMFDPYNQKRTIKDDVNEMIKKYGLEDNFDEFKEKIKKDFNYEYKIPKSVISKQTNISESFQDVQNNSRKKVIITISNFFKNIFGK